MTTLTDIPSTPEQELLALALQDMLQAAAAARILDQQVDFQARRALETAISVCYARPWLDSNRRGKLKKKWLPAAGVPAFSPHDLRHRRATLWHLGGVPAATASALLGHSAQEHLRTYAHAVLDRTELTYDEAPPTSKPELAR